MKHSMQISESIGLGTILALSGGFMDAYSYIERGKVFANAQTGNMLLFGVNLSEGNYQTMLNYLFPVLAFALGIALADTVRTKEPNLLHWRQISVLTEALILIAVSFFLRRSICLPTRLPLLPVAFRLKVSAKFTDKELPQLCASVI